MPISTLMIILWGDVIPKEKQLKTIKTKNKKNKDKGQAFGHIKQLFIFRLKFISFILKYPVKDSGHMKLQPFLDSFFFLKSQFWTKNADFIKNMLTIQNIIRFYKSSYKVLVVWQKLAVKRYPINS